MNVAGRLDSIEATYYYQIVKSRLAVIQRMKEVVHGDDLEKVIQRHLANNLWLLDPAWDRDTKLPSVEEAIKTQFDVINAGLTREEQEARLDVRYQKPSGKHVIIELKRGDRTVKFIELIAQVDKYFSALTKILKNMIQTRILKSSYFLVNAWMAKKLITILKANICASLLKLTHESYIMINCWQMPKLFMQISLRKIAALHHLRH